MAQPKVPSTGNMRKCRFCEREVKHQGLASHERACQKKKEVEADAARLVKAT